VFLASQARNKINFFSLLLITPFRRGQESHVWTFWRIQWSYNGLIMGKARVTLCTCTSSEISTVQHISSPQQNSSSIVHMVRSSRQVLWIHYTLHMIFLYNMSPSRTRSWCKLYLFCPKRRFILDAWKQSLWNDCYSQVEHKYSCALMARWYKA